MPSFEQPLRSRLSLSLLAAAFAFSAAACDRPQKVIDAKRPKLEAAVAQLASVAKELPTLAPLSDDGIKADDGPIKIDSDPKHSNADIMMVEELRGSKGLFDIAPYTGAFYSCRYLLDKGASSNSTSDDVGAKIDLCLERKYVLVIRLVEEHMPEMVEEDSKFKPGSVKGEVHAFNLASGKHLGGFRFDAANDEIATGPNALSAATEDLKQNAQKAIKEALSKYL